MNKSWSPFKTVEALLILLGLMLLAICILAPIGCVKELWNAVRHRKRKPNTKEAP